MRDLHADAVRVVTAHTGTEPARTRVLDFLAANPDGTRRDHPGGHLTASALVVHPDLDRVLLCLHRRIAAWVQLGGHCEDGDRTVAAAALREATEESGIDGLVVSAEPIHLDVHPVRCASGPSLHYDVRYAALSPAGAVERVSAESAGLRWFRPDALPTPLAGATEPLVAPALDWARRLTGGSTSRTP